MIIWNQNYPGLYYDN